MPHKQLEGGASAPAAPPWTACQPLICKRCFPEHVKVKIRSKVTPATWFRRSVWAPPFSLHSSLMFLMFLHQTLTGQSTRHQSECGFLFGFPEPPDGGEEPVF